MTGAFAAPGAHIEIRDYSGEIVKKELAAELNRLLEAHPELTAPLEGRVIQAEYDVREGKTATTFLLKLVYPNGASHTIEIEKPTRWYNSPSSSEVFERLREAAPISALNPESIHEELMWVYDQLAVAAGTVDESDEPVIRALMKRIEKIPLPPNPEKRRFPFSARGSAAKHWIKRYLREADSVRESALKWGSALGLKLTFPERRLAPQTTPTGSYLQPLQGADQALIDRMEVELRLNPLHRLMQEKGAEIKIGFEPPKWVIRPESKMPGRVEVRAKVVVARADGATREIEVVAKLNTRRDIGKLMASDEWIQPVARQLQGVLIGKIGEVKRFLGEEPRFRVDGETGVRVAAAGPAEVAEASPGGDSPKACLKVVRAQLPR